METETVNSRTCRKSVIITSVIIIAFLIYYTVMALISPVRKFAELSQEYSSKPEEKEEINGKVFTDSAYLSLLKEKAFLQSMTLMAQTDSIYMAINLADSISTLEISGVTVHSAKISRYSMSKMLRKGDQNIIYSMLSTPFTIAGSIATIKKEPVMIKTAPKDTSEFKADAIPDTAAVEAVNYILEMTNGTRIYIGQEEDVEASDRRSNIMFDLKDRFRNIMSSLKSIVSFKVPEYHPYIRIRIPRDDGKIIYRALPINGQIAIYT